MGYTTAGSLAAYLGIQSAGELPLLGDAIDRATSAINNATNRSFESVPGTLYYHNQTARLRGQVLYLETYLQSVTGIVNGNGATITPVAGNPSSGWFLEPMNYGPPYTMIRLGFNNPWVFNVDGRITVSGTLGYSATAPDDIVQATLRLASYFYRIKDSQIFDTTADAATGGMTINKGIPADVQKILNRYPKPPI